MAKGILEKRNFLIDYIRRNAPVSRFEIAKRFGMNASTVGNIVEALIDDGLLVEERSFAKRPAAGRPPILLHPNPDAGRFVGVDMVRDRLTAVVTDFAGTPLEKRTVPLGVRASRATVMKELSRLVASLGASPSRGNPVLRAIGLGFPGLVDRESGTAISYHPIRDWRNVPVQETLEDQFGAPVFLEHNSNTMALGETCLGDARDYDHVVLVLLRIGISIGIVRHREIVAQSSWGAGELGHTIVRHNGRKCWCGANGCLECYVSAWALQKQLKREQRQAPDWAGNAALQGTNEQVDANLICSLALAGDARAKRILTDMFRHLGIGINTVARLLAPDAVIVHGSFNTARDLITECVMETFGSPNRHPVRIPELIVSSQDDTIGAEGAALMAASRFFNPIYRMPR